MMTVWISNADPAYFRRRTIGLLLVRQGLDHLLGNVDTWTAVDEIAQGQYQVVLFRLRDYLYGFAGG